MNPVLWAFLVIYTAGLGVLLWVAYRRKKRYAIAKGALSLLFLAGALLAFFTGSQKAFAGFILLLAALALCALGDVMLGIANLEKKRGGLAFLAGAVSFSLAHVLFCALYAQTAPFPWAAPLAGAVLLLVLRHLEAADRIRLKKMRIPGYIYTFLVGTMAVLAAGAGFAAGFITPRGALTALGAALFLCSDVILLFMYFGTRRRKSFRAANLSTYYIGVVLLALSTHWY